MGCRTYLMLVFFIIFLVIFLHQNIWKRVLGISFSWAHKKRFKTQPNVRFHLTSWVFFRNIFLIFKSCSRMFYLCTAQHSLCLKFFMNFCLDCWLTSQPLFSIAVYVDRHQWHRLFIRAHAVTLHTNSLPAQRMLRRPLCAPDTTCSVCRYFRETLVHFPCQDLELVKLAETQVRLQVPATPWRDLDRCDRETLLQVQCLLPHHAVELSAVGDNINT